MNNELVEYKLNIDPMTTFLSWYEEAKLVEDNPEAMTVSTYDLEKRRPQSRTLLYKGIIDQKIIFYTNYLSTKGKQLDLNPEVSLLFYWHKSIRQVRVQGRVVKATEEQSKKYFASRDRDSQLASYISAQSSKINSKEDLLKNLNDAKIKFQGQDVPCPDHWGGYLLTPYEFEFFVYGKNRINDRFLYELKENNRWEISRLQP